METRRQKPQLTVKMAMGDLIFKRFLVLLCIVSLQTGLCASRRIDTPTTVSVSGIVFCNQCSEENELTIPLPGANVKLQCENSLPSSAVTNEIGHFTFTIDKKYYAQHGAGKCKVLLGKSPSSQCDVSTTAGNGVSGATLIKVPAPAGSSLNELKYSVGPFVYKPSHASCKSSANLMFHHFEDTSLHVGSDMLSLFPTALSPLPHHPSKPLPLKPRAPSPSTTPSTKAPPPSTPSTPSTKAPPPSAPSTPSTPSTKAPPPSAPSTPSTKAPPPSAPSTPSTPSTKAPPPSAPSTPSTKAPPPSAPSAKLPLPSAKPPLPSAKAPAPPKKP